MSMVRCEYCDINIDLDFNSEHFPYGCESKCVEQEIDENC